MVHIRPAPTHSASSRGPPCCRHPALPPTLPPAPPAGTPRWQQRQRRRQHPPGLVPGVLHALGLCLQLLALRASGVLQEIGQLVALQRRIVRRAEPRLDRSPGRLQSGQRVGRGGRVHLVSAVAGAAKQGNEGAAPDLSAGAALPRPARPGLPHPWQDGARQLAAKHSGKRTGPARAPPSRGHATSSLANGRRLCSHNPSSQAPCGRDGPATHLGLRSHAGGGRRTLQRGCQSRELVHGASID